VGKIDTPKGPKQIAIESGISDNIYASMSRPARCFAENFSTRHPTGRGMHPGDPLCPGGLTATPIIAR